MPRRNEKGIERIERRVREIDKELADIAHDLRYGDTERSRHGLRKDEARLRVVRQDLQREHGELLVGRDRIAMRRRDVEAFREGLRQVLAARTACGPATAPAPALESAAATWAHGDGRSNVCVNVRGRPGTSGTVTINGVERAYSIAADGTGQAVFLISSVGTYAFTARSDTTPPEIIDGAVTVKPGSDPAGPPFGRACSPP